MYGYLIASVNIKQYRIMSSTKLTVQPQTPVSIKIKKAWKGFMEAGTEDRSKELVPQQYLGIAHL